MGVSEVTCVHRWSDPMPSYEGEGTGMLRHCRGLCGSWWRQDKDPEPRMVIARIETV